MILVNNKVVLGTNINASSNTTPFLYCNGFNEPCILIYASSSSSVLSPGAGGSGTATVLNMKLLLMITPGK